MKKAIKTLSLFLALTIAFSSAFGINKGEQAPDFSLETLDGKKISLAELKGKVVYLDFWASWCGPCRFSLPFMNALHDKYEKDGLVVLAVNIDSDKARAEKALLEVHPNYRVLLDPQSTVPALYEPPKMPSSYIIGRDGKVSLIHQGFKPEDSEEINQAVESVLKEGK